MNEIAGGLFTITPSGMIPEHQEVVESRVFRVADLGVHFMILKTATAKNIGAIIATAVTTSMVMAALLFWLSYTNVERQSVDDIVTTARGTAARIEARFATVKSLS